MTDNNEQNDTQQNNSQENEQQFIIQKIYTKDLSFESPNSPESFLKEWNPDVNMELNTNAALTTDDIFDVILTITITVKNGEDTVYLVEVKQAGLFSINGFDDENLNAMLGSFCPNILFPYARETISDLVTRGGFPPLVLAPVNFDALYQQHLENQQQVNTTKH